MTLVQELYSNDKSPHLRNNTCEEEKRYKNTKTLTCISHLTFTLMFYYILHTHLREKKEDPFSFLCFPIKYHWEHE